MKAKGHRGCPAAFANFGPTNATRKEPDMRSPYAPTPQKDQDRRCTTICRNCGAKIKTRRLGRKRRYCSDRCRVEAGRQLNFPFSNVSGENEKPCADALKNPARHRPSGVFRNAKNSPRFQIPARPSLLVEGLQISGWRRIIDVEMIAPTSGPRSTSAASRTSSRSCDRARCGRADHPVMVELVPYRRSGGRASPPRSGRCRPAR